MERRRWKGRLKTGLEIEYQNQLIEDTIEPEHQNTEDEWEGFEDPAPTPPAFGILPPPVQSFERCNFALEYTQKWAKDHGYALRIRDSRKRQKGDISPQRVVLECDRGGKHKPVVKLTGQQHRRSSTRRRECPFRIIIVQPIKELNGLFSIRYSQAPHNEHNHGPSYLPTAHPIHRRNARNAHPEILQTPSPVANILDCSSLQYDPSRSPFVPSQYALTPPPITPAQPVASQTASPERKRPRREIQRGRGDFRNKAIADLKQQEQQTLQTCKIA
jgi:hypothetical protein